MTRRPSAGRCRSAALALLLPLLAAACGGPAHINPYVPRSRDYQEREGAGAASDEELSPGSLWRDGRQSLVSDWRALRQNDLVVIRVEEIADARRSSDTELSRDASVSVALKAFLNAAASTSSQNLGLETSAKNALSATGSTARTEKLTATVPALVRKVLKNGNLFVEGHRVVLVNSEEHHFYISGVVRPIDIEGDNSVKSSMLADAEIEFTGRGDVTNNQRQGVVSRYLGWLWPF